MGSSRALTITIVATLVGCVLVSVAVVFYLRTTGSGPAAGKAGGAVGAGASAATANPKSAIATFAGTPISHGDFEAAWQNSLKQANTKEADVPPEAYVATRYRVLMQLVDRILYDTGMKELGLQVTDKDLSDVAKQRAFAQIQNMHRSNEDLDFYLQGRNMTIDQYVDEIATKQLADSRDEIEQQARGMVLGRKLTESLKVEDADVPKYLRSAVVQRVTQLYNSPIMTEAKVTEEAAKKRIDEAYKKLTSGAKWEDVVKYYSNGPERDQGGAMPPIQWGLVDDTFDQVCWALKKGDVSKPFQTDTGWHIIKVVDLRSEDPPKEPKKLADLAAGIKSRVAQRMVAKWHDGKLKEGDLQISDPVLAGYNDVENGRYQEGADLLEAAAKEALAGESLRILVVLNQAYMELNQRDRVEQLFDQMLDIAGDEQKCTILITRGGWYLDTKREKEALTTLAEADKLAVQPPQRLALADIYGRSGHADLGKLQLRHTLQMTDEPAAIDAVAQMAGAFKWADIIDAAKAKVEELKKVTAGAQKALQNMQPGAGKEAAPGPGAAPAGTKASGAPPAGGGR